MKKTILFSILFLVCIILGVGFYFSLKGKSFSNYSSGNLIVFYGIGCPHCAKVKEFITENKIKEKIPLDEKEVYFNRQNAKKLKEVAKICGFNENEIGVPFLWDGESQKCIVGDEPIINYFKEKLNL